jgi:hypothetical protein
MRYLELPDREYLLKSYHYDPVSGEITWKVPHGRWESLPAGLGATSIGRKCKVIKIDGKLYAASRIAWLMGYGKDPDEYEVKHINGKWQDLSLKNLALSQRLR